MIKHVPDQFILSTPTHYAFVSDVYHIDTELLGVATDQWMFTIEVFTRASDASCITCGYTAIYPRTGKCALSLHEIFESIGVDAALHSMFLWLATATGKNESLPFLLYARNTVDSSRHSVGRDVMSLPPPKMSHSTAW